MKNSPVQITGDNYLDTLNTFSEGKADELLADPESIAAEKAARESELVSKHGEALRLSREAKGFSRSELAQIIGIEPSTLASVESGQTFLSLGDLTRATKALSLNFSDMIAKGSKSVSIVRAQQGRRFSRFSPTKETMKGYEYMSLAPEKKNRSMEPLFVTLLPSKTYEASSHQGQEFLYVLDGEMEVTINHQTEILQTGDAIYFDADTAHLVRAHGSKPAKILAVISTE